MIAFSMSETLKDALEYTVLWFWAWMQGYVDFLWTALLGVIPSGGIWLLQTSTEIRDYLEILNSWIPLDLAWALSTAYGVFWMAWQAKRFALKLVFGSRVS